MGSLRAPRLLDRSADAAVRHRPDEADRRVSGRNQDGPRRECEAKRHDGRLLTHLREDKAFIQFITSRTFLLWAMLLGAAHLFFMGYEGWLSPDGWHGGIPPVSLVAFAFFTIGYVINLFGRK